MKKITAVLLIFCLLLCACAGRTGQSDPGSSSRTEVSGSSMLDAGNDADKTEGPADTEDISPADGDDGAVWSVSLRELVGKPAVSRNLLALGEDGLVYVIFNEYDEEDKNNFVLISYDPATGTVSQPLWEARYVECFTALENGQLGVLAGVDGTKYLFRLSADGQVLYQSPAIPDPGAGIAVAPGYDAYCYNETETGDLLLYRCAAGEATVICAGNGEGKIVPCYLSPDSRYAAYLKSKDGWLDLDTAWFYDAESGRETAYPLPTFESALQSNMARAGIGGTIYFLENDSWEEELTDRCWRVKDGGELVELTLPFRYHNGSGPIEAGGAIVFTDDSYITRQAEGTHIYLLDENGTAYAADYQLPANYILSAAAVSGDRLVLSVYESGHDVGDSVPCLIETGFSKIG